jgi:DNA-binding response OmpR family regulator
MCTPLEGAAAACRVVVADDHPDMADSLAVLLEAYGFVVTTAYDGDAALAAVRALRPHAVVLDLSMPRGDGLAVCEAVRREPEGEKVTLIALTGWGRNEDRELARRAGFDHYILKPLDVDALLQALDGARLVAR